MPNETKKQSSGNTDSNIPPEKMKAANFAIEQIEKQHGKGAIMRLSDSQIVNVESIPTGCLSLDAAIGIGGVPRGSGSGGA